ncbi:hypothetical protein D9M68_951430 [compost metagenome]
MPFSSTPAIGQVEHLTFGGQLKAGMSRKIEGMGDAREDIFAPVPGFPAAPVRFHGIVSSQKDDAVFMVTGVGCPYLSFFQGAGGKAQVLPAG